MAQGEENIFKNLAAGSIWKTPPTSEQPVVTLIRWSVKEVQNGERHFVGYNLDDCEGRVSTPIESFDPITSNGVTRSGRIYHLKGPAGWDSDGSWVWSCVCSARGLEGKDVTDEYVVLIASHASGVTAEDLE